MTITLLGKSDITARDNIVMIRFQQFCRSFLDRKFFLDLDVTSEKYFCSNRSPISLLLKIYYKIMCFPYCEKVSITKAEKCKKLLLQLLVICNHYILQTLFLTRRRSIGIDLCFCEKSIKRYC